MNLLDLISPELNDQRGTVAWDKYFNLLHLRDDGVLMLNKLRNWVATKQKSETEFRLIGVNIIESQSGTCISLKQRVSYPFSPYFNNFLLPPSSFFLLPSISSSCCDHQLNRTCTPSGLSLHRRTGSQSVHQALPSRLTAYLPSDNFQSRYGARILLFPNPSSRPSTKARLITLPLLLPIILPFSPQPPITNNF